MIASKIKLYLFNQIFKYFFLILFIFLSIGWLLQVTRLLTVTNFINIDFIQILLLSFYLIPNILTIIIPFILIFGLLLCFIKLKKDNELIAIFSLGFGLKPFKETLIFFCFTIIVFFTILNFYLAPSIYEKYKVKEYDLRNTLDLNKMAFSNFLNLNRTTILDFSKKNNEYQDIFISYKDEKENIIYAKKGNIFLNDNKYNFQLTNGFKISINNENEIERLEFLNYTLKIDNKIINDDKVVDQNTFTIIDDLKSKNYLNICFKFFDIILILYVIYLFYKNNLKELKLDTNNNIYFSLSCISILIINQILKNSQITIINYSLFILIIVFLSLFFTNMKKKYE